MKILSMPSQAALSKFPRVLGIACGISALVLSGCHVRSSRSETPLLLESEPNDGAAFAEGVGAIRPGTRLSIRGSVVQNQVADSYETDWSADYFDGFAFVVDQPCELYITLYADRPFADLDVWVYDPYDQSFIAQFEDIYDPEIGAVVFPWVGEEFHVVVSSYSLDSFYTLELEAHPLATSFATTLADSDEAAPELDGRVRPRVIVGSAPAALETEVHDAEAERLEALSPEAPEAPADRPAKDSSRYESYRAGRLEQAPEPIRVERIPLELPEN